MNSKKRVLILSTSPRKNGNSDTLAEEFARGAREAGHEVEKISLSGKEIRFCQGCLACQKTGRCVIHDDADAIVQEKMVRAQVLVFATPIYYYEMCGQMKTMLDRSNPLYSSDYAFRKVYLLATAAEDGDEVWQRAASGLEGWVECFPKARMAGVVFGGGATEVGAIRGIDAMKRAYEAGKNL
ncbi:flavodoxin family protein [Angelakisella massiliensis]|uniref:flavodoxin family protein n=1 Tax=Angelakisella massiliensis TaxID=1871018 RepID=UPI0023A7CB86|nr:flavodoxin family protein [Angelakisella massiliensis]